MAGTGLRRIGRRIAERIDARRGGGLAGIALGPSRRVRVVGIYREAEPIASVVAELSRSHHELDVRLGAMGEAAPELASMTPGVNLRAGKFQNLNTLCGESSEYDWLLVLDDDVVVPPGFLDVVIELSERLDFALVQPAQTRDSHANWPIAKRRFLSLARRTRFVEIGPVTLIRADAAGLLIPFPQTLKYGWGLDFRWAYLMEDARLRMGVIDAVAVRHASRAVASSYSWDAAQQEGRAFLDSVAHLQNNVAKEEALETYRRLGSIPRRNTRSIE